MAILNPTHTIFKSKKISFVFDVENDNRKIIASDDIFEGDLLILEHGIGDVVDKTVDNNVDTTNNRTALNLLYNPEFYKELYPRNHDHNIDNIINNVNDDNINYSGAITDKISKNIFKHEIDTNKSLYVLFRDITNLNHSITPNANHHYLEVKIPNLDIPIIIYYIIASSDIIKGDEITINYGNDYFNENTDLSDYYDKKKPYFKKNDNKIKKLVFKYLNSLDFRDVIYNHHFYISGLIYTQNKYIGLPSFYKLYNNSINKDENDDITIKNMNDWINEEIAKISYHINSYIKQLSLKI